MSATPTYIPDIDVNVHSVKPVRIPMGWVPVLLRDERTGGEVRDWLSSYTMSAGAFRGGVSAKPGNDGMFEWYVCHDNPYFYFGSGQERTVMAACRAAERVLTRASQPSRRRRKP